MSDTQEKAGNCRLFLLSAHSVLSGYGYLPVMVDSPMMYRAYLALKLARVYFGVVAVAAGSAVMPGPSA